MENTIPEIVTYQFGELTLRLKKGRYLDDTLLSGLIFEDESVKALSQMIKPGMVAVDVGANFGYFTLLFSRWVGPTGRVIAFEPTKEYGSRLTEHVAINNITNVLYQQMGLSNRVGKAAINIGECSATCHWAFDELTPRLHEEIELSTLDQWWQDYVTQGNPDKLDALKVDLDGHEPIFLLGAIKTLRKFRPIMQIEFFKPQYEHAGFTCRNVIEFLETNFEYKFYDLEKASLYVDREYMINKLDDPKRSYNIVCLP
ncbi:MAG: FkbM family methyltransferase [Deltaproteobacteria bacterium]|nr:FkbM family methyltransferase [Deltaproteobacteria bacterium]